ncbi:MAG: hypothetical protein JW952_01845, partial [Candidatus Eisenbacteria bacterium]|nr:hypothetical protein [Candidatus Eisenbacteria bacterium]
YTCMEASPDGRRTPVPVRVADPARVLTLSGATSPRERPTRASAVAELTCVLKSSRFVALMKGLASEGWTFYQIDERFVRQALARRDFYVVPAEGSRWTGAPSAAGILVASAQRRRDRLLVWTLADFREDCFPLMLGAARRLAYELGLNEVRLVVPYARVITMPVRAAGFHQEYEGMSSVVMERGRSKDGTVQRERAGRGKARRRSGGRPGRRTKSGRTS